MDAREFGGALAWKTRALGALETSRRRLLALLASVPPEVLAAQHSPLMSPPVWDVAHVANYEEQWLVRALGEPGLSGPETDRLYDAFRNPRNLRVLSAARGRGGARLRRAGRERARCAASSR
jgi:iron(II)-dependent oxidoreductase